MIGKRCSLCGGKLKNHVCTECGLDNSKNDSMYEGLLNQSDCDGEALTHVHETPEKKQKPEKMKPASGGSSGFGKSYTFHQQTQREKKNVQRPSKGPSGKLVKILVAVIFLICLLSILIPMIFGSVVGGVSSLFSSDTISADRDGRYDYVLYDLEDTDVSWNDWLYSGEYKVGVHIPEGTYTVKILEGECVLQVDDYENGIYLWEQFAAEDQDVEDSVIEVRDLRLYKGAVVRIDGSVDAGVAYLDFVTENAQTDTEYLENPLTEDVEIQGGQTLTAGEDFPAGVYDVIGTSGWGYLDFEVSVPAGEEYAPYYINSVWLDNIADGDVSFANLVIPAGVKVSLEGYDESETAILRPSRKIESEDYEAYYLNQ